jgi:AbrB family looped-hinge helix DNA binding protein
MPGQVKVSSKNQIVIPRDAREKLHIKAGTKLDVTVMGDTIILMRVPKSYSKALKGIARPMRYPPDYIDKERDDW